MLKSFKEIAAAEELDPFQTIADPDNIYAHVRRNSEQKETLAHHMSVVMKYFHLLIESNGLEPVIDGMIGRFAAANINDDGAMELVSNFIKAAFIKAIYFHDLGKVNENFQVEKMGNYIFRKRQNEIGSEHSVLSAYIFISHLLSQIDSMKLGTHECEIMYVVTVFFAHSIFRHHGRISSPFDYPVNERLIELLPEYLEHFRISKEVRLTHIQNFLNYNDTFKEITRGMREQLSIYALVKLNSSLLTAADYYATNEYMVGIKVDSFGVLGDNTKMKLIKGIDSISYNRDAYENSSVYKSIPFESLTEISPENLNVLRQKLICEVRDNLRQNSGRRLFYIEAPTGSGKTNLSLVVLRELLAGNPTFKKIFYVFPYLTLITQTLESVRSKLHLDPDEVAEIHSKAAFYTKDDSEYGEDRRNYIDSLFVNYPISFMSHVKFFDIFVSNDKEVNYIFHRLANSVVIVDEVQSYSPTVWDKLYYLIRNYAEQFNVTFILMSATLPKISKILIDKDSEDEFVYLVSNRDKYFLNPNFRNRVDFDFKYAEDWEFSFSNLAKVVYDHSEEYFRHNGRVSVIVEFVTKRSAHRFFEEASCSKMFDDYERLIITGTIIEPRRQEIISRLKANRHSGKTLVVATQVVEAGMDIDMDLGFKDKSIIDSEEQLAGRINRNARKTNARLYLFNSKDSRYPYRSDLRYKQGIELSEYALILRNKDFDRFYQKVLDRINAENRDSYLTHNLPDFVNSLTMLDFKGANDRLRLIESSSVSIFVPLRLHESKFTEGEVRFLKSFDLNCSADGMIDGRCVWNVYKGIVESRYDDFIRKQIDWRSISSIIAKFSFSICNNRDDLNSLRHYGEFEYGFLMLDQFETVYSYENGLSADIETDSIL